MEILGCILVAVIFSCVVFAVFKRADRRQHERMCTCGEGDGYCSWCHSEYYGW